eukprot:TRINITY_DN1735_c0_g1_i1.p1 TRINITY_DN1735_c0_g1~~TRINITY_DN1735_c0_g1_i1.p1  ORF type:complete len:228 (-),score=41.29 TRINITY_DN1735_c0_g1_i1:123-806(-)
MFAKTSIIVMSLAVVYGKQCYECDSMTSNCTAAADHPGDLKTCPENRNNGCYISQILTGDEEGELKVIVSRGCTAEDKDDEFKCDVHRAGSHMFTFCNCRGDSCNQGWKTAAGPPVKCYDCNSAAPGGIGNCSDTAPGVLMECPIEKRRGCYISQASYGTETVYERGCTEVTDPAEYVCKNLGKEGQSLHYCNCQGDACNQNWSTAGAGTELLSLSLICAVVLALFM